jgi:hypothetical protein
MRQMTQKPYHGLSPEELQLAIQRAHAERAKAVRDLFAAILAWRRKASARARTAGAALRPAARA